MMSKAFEKASRVVGQIGPAWHATMFRHFLLRRNFLTPACRLPLPASGNLFRVNDVPWHFFDAVVFPHFLDVELCVAEVVLPFQRLAALAQPGLGDSLPGQLGALQMNPGKTAAALDHWPAGKRPSAVARDLLVDKKVSKSPSVAQETKVLVHTD